MASHSLPEIERVGPTDSGSFFDWKGLKTAAWCWTAGLLVLLVLASTLGDAAPCEQAITPAVSR